MLRSRGVPVLDADLVAREVVEPGTSVLAAIAAEFGPEILGPDGSLDRTALGALVMGDPKARRCLEGLTHPAILSTLLGRLRDLTVAGKAMAVVEAALMIETGTHCNYGELWVVTCTAETQLQRLMARNGFDEETAVRWIRSQLPLAEKEALADRVIGNNGSLVELEDQVSACLSAVASGL